MAAAALPAPSNDSASVPGPQERPSLSPCSWAPTAPPKGSIGGDRKPHREDTVSRSPQHSCLMPGSRPSLTRGHAQQKAPPRGWQVDVGSVDGGKARDDPGLCVSCCFSHQRGHPITTCCVTLGKPPHLSELLLPREKANT